MKPSELVFLIELSVITTKVYTYVHHCKNKCVILICGSILFECPLKFSTLYVYVKTSVLFDMHYLNVH